MPKLTFFGGCREVGRSCILVDAWHKKILLDCGIKLGAESLGKYPLINKEECRKINAVVITHAHLDHCGYLPALVKNGFRGEIYCTKPTRDLMHLLLSDALKIAKEKKEIIYSASDIAKAMSLVKTLDTGYEREIFHGVKIKFIHAGHVLGAVQVILKAEGKKILYTGDLNTRESVLLDGASLPAEKIDCLIIESTYSGKEDSLPNMQKAGKELADVIKETLKKHGKVLIPVFGVGRGQEIMLTLENYAKSGYLPKANIFLDGMINRASRIYRHNVIYLKLEIPKRILLADDDPFKSSNFKVPKTRNKSDVLKSENAIILATSGMLTGGPSVGYFKKMCDSEKNCILFVGYQSEGSIGREILDGKKDVEIDGKLYKVNCKTKNVPFSGHTDYNGLLKYVFHVKPRKIFIVHGEERKSLEFSNSLKKRMRKTEIIVPANGESLNV